MNHGFAFQLYDTHGGPTGSGTIISHATVVDGTGAWNGGSIIMPERSSNIKIVNSILAYNGGAATIHFYPVGSPGTGNNGDHLVFYSNSGGNYDISSGWTITNERSSIPLFEDRPNRNYRLAAGSPALGYTDSSYSPAYDIDGNPRPPGAEDAGAFERVP
jgi:hypothetical protein